MPDKKYITKFTHEQLMDFVIGGIHAIAGKMIEKALAPVNQRLAALEVENATLRDAVKELREAEDTSPAAFVARYAALQ